MSMWISVLVTASGFIGLAVTILSIFLEIKPAQKIHISAVEMFFVIVCLALLILGSVNLYYVLGSRNDEQEKQNSSIQEWDDPGEDDVQTVEDLDEDLSSEELFVRQNLDLIQQLKSEYSETDMRVVESESNSVQFFIQERAGYVFQNLMKTGEYDILGGDDVSAAKMIVLDYNSDEIICTLTSDENGLVRYSPGNQNTFYCIVSHEDYDIYVTPPLQVISGEYLGSFSIYLEEKGSEYMPLCQFRLFVKDSDKNVKPSAATSKYDVLIHFEKIFANDSSRSGGFRKALDDTGILSCRGTYFSISTKYVMDISLLYVDYNLQSTHQRIDSPVTNSNQVDLYFEFDTEE